MNCNGDELDVFVFISTSWEVCHVAAVITDRFIPAEGLTFKCKPCTFFRGRRYASIHKMTINDCESTLALSVPLPYKRFRQIKVVLFEWLCLGRCKELASNLNNFVLQTSESEVFTFITSSFVRSNSVYANGDVCVYNASQIYTGK